MLRAAQRLSQRAIRSSLVGCSAAAAAAAAATACAGRRQLPRASIHRTAQAPFSCFRPLHKRAPVPADAAEQSADERQQTDTAVAASSLNPAFASERVPLSTAASTPLPLSPPPPPPSDFERSFLVSPNPAAKHRSVLNKAAFLVTEVGLAFGAWLCASGMVRAITLRNGVPSPHDLLPMLFSDTDAALLLLGQSAVVLPTTILFYVAAQGLASKFWPSVMRVTIAPPPPPPPSEATADSSTKSGSQPQRGYSFFRGTRPKPSLPRAVILVLACIAGQVAVLFALQHVDAASPEEPMLVEVCLTGGKDLMAIVAVIGPLGEEIFFRGFLFARLARVTGVLPALLVSSVLFGAMHWSPSLGSEKVVAASVVGSLFAVVHRLVQTLKAPVIMHSLSNSVSFAQQGAASPLKNMEKLEIILQNQWNAMVSKDRGIARRKRQILLRLGGLLPASAQTDLFSRWLSADLASLSPAAESLVSSLFRGLDRDQKGYLSPEEFAYGFMLCPQHHRYFNAVIGVLERTIAEGSERGGGLEGAAGAIGGTAGLAIVQRRSAERAAEVIAQAEGNLVRKRPRDRPLIQLPNSDFFSAHDRQLQRVAVSSLLLDPQVALPLELPSPPWSSFSVSPGLIRPSGFRLAPSLEAEHAFTSARCTALQRRIVDQYYDAYWSAAFRAHFERRIRVKQGQRRPDGAALTEDASNEATATAIAPADYASLSPSSTPAPPAASPGCTLPAFSRFIASELLLRPEVTVAWLSALSANLRSEAPSPLQPHPMQRLIEEHAKGRQGHLGHRRHAA